MLYLWSIIVTFTGVLPSAVLAQKASYSWQADIQPVEETGFYSLPLKPELVGRLAQPHLEDIRIYRDKQEIPYIIRRKDVRPVSSFDSLPIISYAQDTEQHSVLTIRNPKKQSLNHLLLTMNNASADKQVQVSGSYDREKWYIVREKFWLNSAISSSAASRMIARIELPETAYPFYKLIISDSTSAPLYIMSAGRDTVQVAQTNPHVEKLPHAAIKKTQSSSSSTSLWQVAFDRPYLVYQLSFDVSSPDLYRREVRFLQKHQSKDRRGRLREQYSEIGRGILDPNKRLFTLDSEVKTDSIYVEIDNGNNVPLQLSAVNAWQMQYDLVAYLEKGTKYELALGNPEARGPDYDLGYFENKIKENVPIIRIEALRLMKQGEKEGSFTLFQSTYWIWAGLALLILLLLWMSNRLLKDMKKKA